VLAAGVAVAVLAGVAVFAVYQGKSAKDAAGDGSERGTAVVEYGPLVAGLDLRGSLVYGNPRTLTAVSGVITRVPAAGDEVAVGQAVMEVEGNPVLILRGAVPLWRPLTPGLAGVDVAGLRQALNELGYAAGSGGVEAAYDAQLAGAVDALYAAAGYPNPAARPEAVGARADADAALAAAESNLQSARAALNQARKGPGQAALVEAANSVARAQRDLDAAYAGLEGAMDVASAQEALTLAQAQAQDARTPVDTSAEAAAVDAAVAARDGAREAANQARWSTVGPKDIIMVPTSTMRVDNVKVEVGAMAEGPVLTYTDTTLYGRIDLTDSQYRNVVTGSEVTVTLGDATEIKGVVGDLKSASVDEATGQPIPASARIDIEDQTLLRDLGPSGIKVALVLDSAEPSLVVPITALMALAEGGYCVELEDGTLVGVEVGLVADTRAQVTPVSGELSEGDVVVIA
jgi:hypothetical protein